MIAFLLASSLWIGDRLPSPPGDLNLWLAIGYAHEGAFVWPAGQRLWIETPSGWVRDSALYVFVPGATRWIPKQIPARGLELPRERVRHDIGKRNRREGAVILGVFPVNHEAKVKKVEARR